MLSRVCIFSLVIISLSPLLSNLYISYQRMIRSVAVISTMLMTMEMELTALASPKSLFISAVNAGAADAMGLKGRIART